MRKLSGVSCSPQCGVYEEAACGYLRCLQCLTGSAQATNQTALKSNQSQVVKQKALKDNVP